MPSWHSKRHNERESLVLEKINETKIQHSQTITQARLRHKRGYVSVSEDLGMATFCLWLCMTWIAHLIGKVSHGVPPLITSTYTMLHAQLRKPLPES